MITFRAHVVSLIACLFFLAVGIFLGAGPLKGSVDETLTSQVGQLREDNQDLREQIAALEREAAYREAFDGRVEPLLTTGRLQDLRVSLVTLPGADDELVAAVRDSLRTAGASVPATVTVAEQWTDPDSGQVLDSLAAELVTEGTTLPEGDGFDRGAALLAGAVVSADAATPPTSDSPGAVGAAGGPAPENQDAVIAALTEAGLVTVEGDPAGTAQAAVVVAGPPLDGDDADDRNARLLPVASALDAAGSGTVVAGTEASAADGGLVALVRADDGIAQAVSTVDVAGLASGRTATVFALLEQLSGASGQYGAVGQTDGPLPADVAPTPAPTGS